MSQIRTRHHEDGSRRRPAVAGSRDRARRTLQDGDGSRPMPASEPVRTASPATRPAPPALAPRTGRRPFSGGWPMVAALVLAALLVGLVVTAGLLGTRANDQGAVDRARDRALAAARTEAQAFLSYDYRTLDADFAKARGGLTGRFAGEYATTTQKVVRPTATQYKAQVKAEVISLGVVDARADQVVVIAFVDQTTTSSRLAGPKVDANRVRLTLVPVRGEWKVSAVDAL
jgi:Mce-associated membrane protein